MVISHTGTQLTKKVWLYKCPTYDRLKEHKNQTWTTFKLHNTALEQHYSSSLTVTESKLNPSLFLTYSGPVLPNQPQMVAKEGQNTDAEHGCHKEKEQDVEFGVSIWQLVLGEVRGREEESTTNLS